MEKKKTEKIIVFLYSVYALVLIFTAAVLSWPVWINLVTPMGILTVWVAYLRGMKDYRFRAVVYSAVALATFALYSTQESSFEGTLTTYCAVVVVLSILDIPEIVVPEYIFAGFLVVYHGVFLNTVPHGTVQETIRSAVQILSVFAVVGITHHLIQKHGAMNRRTQEIIEDLRAAERSKMDFLANVSHEIRTPVNTICGISEMILQEDISDGVREDALSVQTAGRNLLSIISDVLDFSKLESGKMTLVEEPYHLSSTINDVINMATAYMGSRDLELIVDCDARIPYTLLGDEQKVRRVILNLVSNAIKFTQNGCVTLAISAREEEYGVNLCVKVQDTGIGIAEEDQEKLFSGLYQADTRRSRQEGGIGIGLAISRKMVQKMNGFISMKSEPGKGSEFQFVVPQKVVDRRPMVAVRDAEELSVIFCIDTEKASFAEIRDHYMNSICHIMEGLEVRYHRCRDLGEFKRRCEKERYTHALITGNEYLEDRAYFDRLSEQMEIVMIQDRGDASVPGGSIRTLHKPFYALSLAAVLNGARSMQRADGSYVQEKRFAAPDACVLVVDDNLMNLKVVEGLLRPYRIRIMVASGGEECLAKLERTRCDIIFMDHMMPGMDGVETVHRIRNMVGAYFRNVPIIALTANAIDGAREMFLDEGFQDYITKPIEMTRMETILRKYIPEDKLIWMDESVPPAGGEPDGPRAEKAEKRVRVDREKGIRYLGGNPEDYEEVLQVYLADGRENIQILEEKCRTEDWKNYAIYVHALKSNSFGIGADGLGELAKELELAAREEDAARIHARHGELLREYEAVLSEIAAGDDGLSAEGRDEA